MYDGNNFKGSYIFQHISREQHCALYFISNSFINTYFLTVLKSLLLFHQSCECTVFNATIVVSSNDIDQNYYC